MSFVLFSCNHDIYNKHVISVKNNINHTDIRKNDTSSLSACSACEGIPDTDNDFTEVNKSDIDLLIKAIKLEQQSHPINPDRKIATLKHNYPFVLVGETDYGILKEPDFWFYKKFDRRIDPHLGHDYLDARDEFYYSTGNHAYWQCFPKENITITLTEYSIDSDEKDLKSYKEMQLYKKNYKNSARLNLEITVFIGNSITQMHYYKLGDYADISIIKNILNRWDNILLHEDYLCLGGVRTKYDDRVSHNVFHAEPIAVYQYYWKLYDIKTKHNCYGFADTCKSRLQKFQKSLRKINK